jgi:ribosomal protein L24E
MKIASNLTKIDVLEFNKIKNEVSKINWDFESKSDLRGQQSLFSSSIALHLRVPNQTQDQVLSIRESSRIIECKDTYRVPDFPEIMSWTYSYRKSRLGRIMIVRMRPRSYIPIHVDSGEYFSNYERLHVPIQTNEHVLFFGSKKCESVCLKSGYVWKLHNQKPHGVFNDSDDYRIHLVFDVFRFNYRN